MAIGAIGFALSLHFGLIGGPQFTEGLVVSERPMSLNPLVDAADPAVVDVGHLLYRSLLKLDSSGYPTTDLAESYAVSSNGLVYTVVLRPDTRVVEWRADHRCGRRCHGCVRAVSAGKGPHAR